MRHCATNRKGAGSVPDRIDGIFHWLNSSSRTMALGSTQYLMRRSTRGRPGGLKRPVRRADELTTSICRLPRNSGCINLLEP
jgi:hypothetical protein